MKKITYILSLLIVLVGLIPAALPTPVSARQGTTDEIQPDGDSGYDSYMSALSYGDNFGSSSSMRIGHTGSASVWTAIEDTDLTYSPAFGFVYGPPLHGGSYSYSNASGAYAEYSALTSGFSYYTYLGPGSGIVEIFIDGVSVGLFDLYAPANIHHQLIYSVDSLTLDTHTIRIVNTGTKNAASSDYYETIDYIGVLAVGDDTSRGIINFDMSGFASDVKVTSATLSLWVAEDLADNASTFEAYTLQNEWDENWVTYLRSDNSDGSGASWTDVLWQIAGAGGSNDILAEPSGSVSLTAELTAGSRVDLTLNPDDITNMIRSNYFGFVLRTQAEVSDAYTFHTSDSAVAEMRPMLTITYETDITPPEVTWNCVDASSLCWPPLNPARAISPFVHKKMDMTAIGDGHGFGGPWISGSQRIGAKLNCEPYPRCKNDWPVYYRLYYRYDYRPGSFSGVVYNGITTTTVRVMGGSDVVIDQKVCSSDPAAWSGSCFGVLQGTIDPEQIPTTAQAYDFAITESFAWTGGNPVVDFTWNLYLSLDPFTEECADSYTVGVIDTYQIDPTIETPVGMIGVDETPTDQQGYTTVVDQLYMLQIQDGPWNDGTTNRYDTEVSTDGTTYIPIAQFAEESGVCLESSLIHPEWLTIYFSAPTTTFYIRVADTPGAFADNFMNQTTPLTYSIGMAEEIKTGCELYYITPSVDTYQIDPTIETPVGMIGDETPVDQQGFPTEADAIYKLSVFDGPWNDGTADRYDSAISVNGMQWVTLTEFAASALCSETDPEHPELMTVYFRATTTTFYIRVNDDFLAFGNNTSVIPLSYSIGLSFETVLPVDCTAQYTNEEVIASVILPSTAEEVAVNNENTTPIIPGDWYGIEIVNGTWSDSGGAERIDLEFKFDAGGMKVQDWQVLADGSHLVYCESNDHKIIFVQALGHEGQILSLRVNDQDNPKNWGDNSGILDINVYHADFTRIPRNCELGYNLGNMITQDVVAGNAENGKIFGFTTPGDVTIVTGKLKPGATYALDTTGGPWYQTYTGGGYNVDTEYYEMKVKTADGAWSKLEPWDQTLCFAKLDGLGHQRIYFQAPADTAIEYSIKVGGASPFTRGEEGWILYEAYDNGNTGTSCNNIKYDPDEQYSGGYVDSTLEDGYRITMLEPDQFFAIEILVTAEASDPPDYRKSGWWEESSSSEELDTVQITRDGINWNVPEDSPAVVCYTTLPSGNLLFFIKTSNGAGDVWALRVNSSTFVDNIGAETYNLYHADGGGLNPWVSCLQDYAAYLPALNSMEPIPVKNEEGIKLLPMDTSPETIDTNNDGLVWWGNLWLMPGHIYEVDTANSQARGWEEEGEHDGKAAWLSSDDGTTWFSFDTHPDVICFRQESDPEPYWKAIFEVTDGQKWRIRVADDAGDFADNTGSLYYNLFLINEFPTCVFDCGGACVFDCGGGGEEVYDVCVLANVMPEPLSLSELSGLGNYFGDWFLYVYRSATGYFAWCQRHSDLVRAGIEKLKTKEPYGTVEELGVIEKNLESEVKSYNWDSGGADALGAGGPVDTSIFDFGNADGVGPSSASGVNQIFETYVMPSSGQAYDVWDGGNAVNFQNNTGLPEFYNTCSTVFSSYLPSKLRTGACFASAYWHKTGASFWVQLLLDIAAIFFLIGTVKGAIQSLVYMMTGVRIWTKERVATMVIGAYANSEAAKMDAETAERQNRLLEDLANRRR